MNDRVFCEPRSSLENPSYRVNSQGRTAVALGYGEVEGPTGDWAGCEETGESGLLPESEDCFWIHDEEGCFEGCRPAFS